VTGVSPSEGSLLGGTLLTIQGHYFDETDQPVKVLVGGNPLKIFVTNYNYPNDYLNYL